MDSTPTAAKNVIEGAPAVEPSGVPSPTSATGSVELGRGRSGVVYRGRDTNGDALACKVFGSSGLTKLVQFVFLGAPNPYQWNADAVRCAELRRRILAELVPLWFAGETRVRVANARGSVWNDEHAAFELRTELVDGRAPSLHHPLRMGRGGGQEDEVVRLTKDVMQPLQERLRESGFEGLLWQAGWGNPVALNNFLLVRSRDANEWAWIDLESGVPALFPLDPRTLFRFYLPAAFRNRRPLFDDVDVPRLRAYLERPENGIEEALGRATYARLLAETEELETRQLRWKSLRRHVRSIGYRLSQGDIDEESAERYRRHPLLWYAREARRGVGSLGRKVGRLPGLLFGLLAAIPYRRWFAKLVRFLRSQRYRAATARRLVARRIQAWRDRGQMIKADADFLRSRLGSEESSSYLADFAVHLGLKPFVKAVEFWAFPAMYAVGWIGEGTLALGVVGCGPLARTLYTMGRLVQSSLHGRERPWIALGIGVFPVIGNFAYPIQLLYSSTEREDHLARFILHDGFARIGRHLPIWGGADTGTEHALNRLPDRLFGLRRA